MKKNILFSLVFLWVSKGYAHKVNIFVWLEGKRVFCECYYPDGSKVKDGKIEVLRAKDGKKLLEGKTDDKGIFSFDIPEKTDLKIVLYAGMGHRAETEISESELPEVQGEKEERIKLKEEIAPSISEEKIKEIFEGVLEEKLHPIYRKLVEIEKQKTIRFNDIIGGIGYIFGILGIIAFFMRKRK